jgi:hypothetical protein
MDQGVSGAKVYPQCPGSSSRDLVPAKPFSCVTEVQTVTEPTATGRRKGLLLLSSTDNGQQDKALFQLPCEPRFVAR